MATYHHGDLRTALLDAAGRIVEKSGPAGLSVREAARRAGVSHGAPYRHFPDRDSLLDALAGRAVQLLDETIKDLAPAEMAKAYVRFARANPEQFRLMFSGRRQVRIEARFTVAYAAMGPIAAAAAWSLVHGLSQLLVEGNFPGENADAFAERVLSAVRLLQRAPLG